jgi:histidinol-phosphate aminotransferase
VNRRAFLRAGTALGLAGLAEAALPRGARAERLGGIPAAPASGPLRLNFNENSLGLSPQARQAVIDVLGEACRYPDEAYGELAEVLAERHGVPLGSVVLGNGSTEILQMAVQAWAGSGAKLVLAAPTFEAVLLYQRRLGYRVEKVPLDAQFAHDLDAMSRAAENGGLPTVVYLCNPNNPTATITSSAAIGRWIGEAPESTLFLVDEAYFEYVRAPGYESAVRWIADHPNVVVSRTFSKIYGMAGLRLGYGLAHPDTARRLDLQRASDNGNAAALAAALASLGDSDLVPTRRASNEAAKKIVVECLDDLAVGYLPSHANFLMHRIEGDGDVYRRRMREAGVLVGRPFPPLLGYDRLTLGLPSEMERFTEVLRGFREKGWV